MGCERVVGILRAGMVVGWLERPSVRKLQCSRGKVKATLAAARHREHTGESLTRPCPGWPCAHSTVMVAGCESATPNAQAQNGHLFAVLDGLWSGKG